MRRLLALALLCAACGPLPQEGPQRGLYVDLRTLVENEQRTDWLTDPHEVDEIAPRALVSACQVSPGHRTALREWLEARVIAEGGPVERAWERHGELEPMRELLTLHRVGLVLDHVDERTDDCPFWLEVDDDFRGVQSDAGRVVLMAESLGALQMFFGGQDDLAGGSGAGRLMVAGGLDARLSLASGLEAGVASTFPRDEEGRRSVRAAFTGALPVMLRVKDGTWRYDSEVAFTARAPDRDLDDVDLGLRVGQSVGVAAPRIARLMPFIGLWVSHEWLPAPELHILRVGTRFGVELDPR